MYDLENDNRSLILEGGRGRDSHCNSLVGVLESYLSFTGVDLIDDDDGGDSGRKTRSIR